MTIDLEAYDTDKSEAYLARYRLEFGALFDKPIKLLELGVQRGGSMYLWRDLLPQAEIAGLDLNEIPIDDESGRLHVYQGYQQDPEVLDRIAAEVAPEGFDVIIDDASHVGVYTSQSFWHLFPKHLKPGGIYVLDDWGSAYWPEWTDGHAFRGPRATLGDVGSTQAEVEEVGNGARPGRIEQFRRDIRGAARPIAAKVPASARPFLERAYMRVEGASMQRRFRSHDYGMAGFVKQLIDAASIADIDRGTGRRFDNGIASVHVYESQAFVHKKP